MKTRDKNQKTTDLLKLAGLLILLLALMLGATACGKGASSDSGGTPPLPGEATPSDEPSTNGDFHFPKEESPSGDLTKFNTLDIQGNPVDQSIFADNKLTMVNFWGTFCSPCLEEMPYLAELAGEYKDKGFGVVGVVVDVKNGGALEPDQVHTAQTAAEKAGANYTHLIPSQGLDEGIMSKIKFVPYTIFVDSKGKQVGEEHIGSLTKDEWEKIIKKQLP